MSRFLLLGLIAALVSCTSPISGTPVTSGLPTNSAGRPQISFDPCTAFPANVLQKLDLTRKPPKPSNQTDGNIENKMCHFYSTHKHSITVGASNYTLEMDKKVTGHWGFQDIEVGGRKALSYYLLPEPDQTSCAIDVAASTGSYGVLVGSAAKDFSPYVDCLDAARGYIEAFLPYLPL